MMADRRTFPRLYIFLPFEYVVQLDGAEEPRSDRATLKDISMTGLRFTCTTTPSLKPGDVGDFIFKFPQSDLNPLQINEMRAKGLVKRINPVPDGSAQFEVVVEFLSGPIFKQADY